MGVDVCKLPFDLPYVAHLYNIVTVRIFWNVKVICLYYLVDSRPPQRPSNNTPVKPAEKKEQNDANKDKAPTPVKVEVKEEPKDEIKPTVKQEPVTIKEVENFYLAFVIMYVISKIFPFWVKMKPNLTLL